MRRYVEEGWTGVEGTDAGRDGFCVAGVDGVGRCCGVCEGERTSAGLEGRFGISDWVALGSLDFLVRFRFECVGFEDSDAVFGVDASGEGELEGPAAGSGVFGSAFGFVFLFDRSFSDMIGTRKDMFLLRLSAEFYTEQVSVTLELQRTPSQQKGIGRKYRHSSRPGLTGESVNTNFPGQLL